MTKVMDPQERDALLARIRELEAHARELETLREGDARALSELSPDAILVNSGGIYVYANPAAARLLHAATPHELIGRTPYDLIPEEYHERVRDRIRHVLETGGEVPLIEYEWRRADGSRVPVEVAAGPTRWRGEPAVQVVARDLTARRQAEAAVREAHRESERRFRTMAESVPQVVWTAGPDGAVDYYNQRWFDYTGLRPEDGQGEGWQDVVHPDDQEVTTRAWLQAVATGGPYEVMHRIRDARGEYRWMLSRGIPSYDADGRVVKWFGSATDIDQQKRVEYELRHARDEAEGLNRAKDQFLAVVSHELRTPLNAIIGYVDLLALQISGPLTAGQESHLSRIAASSHHLLSLIDQVLTFTRNQAIAVEPRPERVELARLLAETAALVEPAARSRGLDYQVQVDDARVHVAVDAAMLRQILLNLLSNAVKFTDSGSVVLRAAVRDGRLECEVADTGIGVLPEHRERVFEPFWQADASLTRRADGTGLGLAVAHRLVVAQGGEITVGERPGGGSSFRFRLPVGEPA